MGSTGNVLFEVPLGGVRASHQALIKLCLAHKPDRDIFLTPETKPLVMLNPMRCTVPPVVSITRLAFCASSTATAPSAAVMVTSLEIVSVEVTGYVPAASRIMGMLPARASCSSANVSV